jgi:adenylate cyclase class 2
MPTEIEAKIKLENLENFAKKLKSLGARLQRDVLQRDFFFDRPDRSLKNADCGLRIRQEKYRDVVKNILCFKGPKATDSPYKKRQEIEFETGDGLLARQFLQALGYQLMLTFEKRRAEWLFDECTICLDEVAVLGKFLEIEGPDESAVRKVLTALGLSDQDSIRQGYSSMLYQRAHDAHTTPPHEFYF